MYLIKSPRSKTSSKVIKGTGVGLVVISAIAAVTGMAYWYMRNNQPERLPDFLKPSEESDDQDTSESN